MQDTRVQSVVSTGIPLLLDDIDTDRIIPARFLRCVTFDGLGDHAFEDDREQDPNHPFNDAKYRQAGILIGGRNFGCGSSREHAPQSLMRWGIRAVLAESFAEIFFGNCTSLGIPAICLSRDALAEMNSAVLTDPNLEIKVDLEQLQVRYADQVVLCALPESARDALTTGEWDFLGQLLAARDQIQTTARQLPYLVDFAS